MHSSAGADPPRRSRTADPGAVVIGCRRGCPVRTDAGRYAQALARGDLEGAVRIARARNPLVSICAYVCPHPCESQCVRGRLDAPVRLRALKRHAVERCDPHAVPPAPRGHRGRGRRIAVIGAGPAGLGAAHDLSLLGYRVTLFEASDRAGGTPSQAILPFRLPPAALQRDVDAVLALDVELRTGARLGTDLDVDSLLDDGFERVLVATGLPTGTALPLEGAARSGVFDGLALLRRLQAGEAVTIGARVLVLGGGDTAVDVARALRRLTPDGRLAPEGQPVRDPRETTLVFRRRELHERAHPTSARAALADGVRLRPGALPVRIEGDEHVEGLTISQVATFHDTAGRYRPRPRPGTRERLTADAVVIAVGRSADPDRAAQLPTARGPSAGELPHGARWAAAGDLVRATTVIGALAQGQALAAWADRSLAGGTEPPRVAVGAAAPTIRRAPAERRERPRAVAADQGARLHGGLADADLDAGRAVDEGARCLDCWTAVVADDEAHRCVLCGRCVAACPGDALSMRADGDSTRLVIDDAGCLRCGLCVQRCPARALAGRDVAPAEARRVG